MWTRQDGSHVSAISGSSLLLIFNPLRTSDAGHYTCTATVLVPDVLTVSGEESLEVIVQSELIVKLMQKISLIYKSLQCTVQYTYYNN